MVQSLDMYFFLLCFVSFVVDRFASCLSAQRGDVLEEGKKKMSLSRNPHLKT